MKGVILAGGSGTRLSPLTRFQNKHLLPVGRQPMIYYAVQKLKEAGIDNQLLITGRSVSGGFTTMLGSGQEFGVDLTYRIQENPGGIAEALLLAKPFIGKGEKFVVLLGDNLFSDSLAAHVQQFAASEPGLASVLLTEVDDPERYGVPELNAGRIVRIEEKPQVPKSNYCVTGIYMYDSSVFEVITTIQLSARGELEITDVNNVYAAQGKLSFDVLTGWWTDAGTFGSMHEAAGKLLKDEELH
ncbi:sugar phosphate nucleotidyltransferase [Paenibacillus sp. y28]|uniref:sugar phosphate nucleotidyltransferase n=1 Tax=Paenibacillus sp. y28 TaxID=3129110 RepID=UPI003019849F